MKHALSFGLAPMLAAAILAGPARAAGASDGAAERDARWREVAKAVFGDRRIEPTDGVIRVDAPARALDASLVPITLTMTGKERIKAVHFVIDDNPSPYAAHFVFGSAGDPGELKLRVRVNTYTNVHAIAETKDGGLYEAAAFVKASGGCSAPMGMSDEEAMKGMGDMRMKFSGDAQPGRPVEATLMIRHPNFSGMQMNQVSRDYTPARYINRLVVTAGDKTVFTMDGDISIASNPVIGFGLLPEPGKPITVAASDSQGGRWERSFDAPGPSH